MTEELDRTDHLTVMQMTAASKLDYFILGVALAISAYLAQTNPYAPLGINKETFLLLSLLIFAASAVCGFLRLEFKVKEMGAYIQVHESPTLEGRVKPTRVTARYFRRGRRAYRSRNFLLLIGLACYVTTKIGASYQSSGWIMVQ
ncbi:hypothetical protein OC610_00840 [Pseudomonas sp. SAICEU22]|uniref:Uncharacterized protein n=1 Tax=Pseudomonas agronomica TaxID=2979328 RepID=A0ABT3F1I2_9PSED|nr:hypothetical protein [Pseudomonas agronomica]MCW1242940.1 hypothetical protein [Pseudomonas agronomica]